METVGVSPGRVGTYLCEDRIAALEESMRRIEASWSAEPRDILSVA